MIDKRLRMEDIAEKIKQDFGSDLNVIYNDDNSEKLILRIRIVNETERADSEEAGEDDVFLQRIEENMLNKMALRGIPDIRKVFMREEESQVIDESTGAYVRRNEWVLDTEGVNLLAVMSHPKVDATRTYSNDICGASCHLVALFFYFYAQLVVR
jgi:DNA-directed RNA polymerase II subunit RPB1